MKLTVFVDKYQSDRNGLYRATVRFTPDGKLKLEYLSAALAETLADYEVANLVRAVAEASLSEIDEERKVYGSLNISMRRHRKRDDEPEPEPEPLWIPPSHRWPDERKDEKQNDTN